MTETLGICRPLIDEDGEVDLGDGEEAVRKEADDLKDRENSGECSRDEAERYIVVNPDTKASCTSSRFLSSSFRRNTGQCYCIA
jgi:hypothetical protein